MKKREMLNGVVNRIALIGVELEGGWDASPGVEVIHDGSVAFPPPQREIIYDGVTGVAVGYAPVPRGPQFAVGEVVSPPMKAGEIEAWVTAKHPQHVNGTCGLHVHMSFQYKLNYSRLMTPDFTPYMVEALKDFGRRDGVPEDHMLWQRLDPNHPWALQHCSHKYCGDRQVSVRGKDYRSRGTEWSRYTAINYCAAQHNTVECRLLPMFAEPDRSVRAIMAVVDATNRFLSKMRQRERKASAGVSERPAVYQEFGVVVR